MEKVSEYLCDALRNALTDQDPYVRKTAAVAVAKLYDTNPALVLDTGYVFANVLLPWKPIVSPGCHFLSTCLCVCIRASIFRFVDDLKHLLSDGNPMVIANAVAALSDISGKSEEPMFSIGSVVFDIIS